MEKNTANVQVRCVINICLMRGKSDVVYAFHPEIDNSNGAKDMIKRVNDAKMAYTIIC